MFASLSNPRMAYNQVGVEARVASADPHQLILMLFDGAMMSVSTASHQIDMGDTAGKGQSISRAIDIVGNGLKNHIIDSCYISSANGFSLINLDINMNAVITQ